MKQFEAPRADAVVLTFMIFAIGVMGCFGATMYWLMQPTVIANVALLEPKRAQPFLHEVAASPVPEMEQAALDVANEENAELGFKTPVVIAAAPLQPEPVEVRIEARQQPKPKPRKVAQAQRYQPDQRHAWDGGQWGGSGWGGGFFGFR